MTRWRQRNGRMGAERLETLLWENLAVALKTKVIEVKDLER